MDDVSQNRFPGRLHHQVPGWVTAGAVFHIRVRAVGTVLTEPEIAEAMLESVRFYHETGRWHAVLVLLMPDHLHALLAFPPDREMSKGIGAWKAFQAKELGVVWQSGFFDHRIRREEELATTWDYIRRNPVVKKLCKTEEDWRWCWSSSRG
ncbi:transposase [Actomonas aquatica]|uniref:Transposase n=1 Tax=Actomonas aquatica TaxID=2866162 RepID=A0ABZ1C3Z0_9BACT|nr:transposase [Opitutus sp. WL0086]WRQ86428.1 transposase [Opitutus sp. WL0086]